MYVLEYIYSIYTTGYYSIIKRNEILIQATTWINPENIMLSARSHSQR